MRISLLGLGAGILLSLPYGPAALLLAQPTHSYTIDVSLNVEERSIGGDAEIVWTNLGGAPTDELWFHLYLNAFRDADSTFAREGFYPVPWSSEGAVPGENWGSIEVETLGFATLPDEPPIEEVSRDFGEEDRPNAEDRTVLRVRLSRPVRTGETIQVQLSFLSRLPRGIARTGWARDYFFAGQWYPKLGVYRQGVWDCPPYHSNTEYFAEFADYIVDVEIPDSFTIGGTGNSGLLSSQGGRSRYRFRQARVHDFAWVASPRFIQRGFTLAGARPTSVNVQLLLLRENEHLGNRYLAAAQRALSSFERWFGVYPYPTLTLVDPPAGSDTDGMEYPSLVTLGSDYLPGAGDRELEAVTFHEIAHQWWYGVVASNEFVEAWLDEGLATFAEMRLLQDSYPDSPWVGRWLGGLPWREDGVSSQLEAPTTRDLLGAAAELPISTPSLLLGGRPTYETLSYSKPYRALATLEGQVGRQEMDRFLQVFFARFSFRHATGQDLIDVCRETLGDAAAALLESAIRTPGAVDYAIESVRSWPAGKTGFEHEIRLLREGSLDLPVEVHIEFESGQASSRTWHPAPNEQIAVLNLTGPEPLRKVVLDPGRKIALDRNPVNNSAWAPGRPEREDPGATYRWSSEWLFWLQTLMEALSLVG